jgi:hypothetical protein
MVTQPPSFPPKLSFGSVAIYPPQPRTTTLQHNAAAFIVSGVKRDAVTRDQPHRSYIQIAIDKLVELMPGSGLEGFFESDAVLVPMPGSSHAKANSVTATRSIAKVMLGAGLGARVIPYLIRNGYVPKSAYAERGNRPDPITHFSTMGIVTPLHEPDPTKIILVDDVVTRGATAMGAAARLREKFPRATIKLFAIARTDQLTERFWDPRLGSIVVQPNGHGLRRYDYDVSTGGPETGRLF